MDEADDFAALYKKLINANFTPQQGRAEAALRSILRRLPPREPPPEPKFPELPSG